MSSTRGFPVGRGCVGGPGNQNRRKAGERLRFSTSPGRLLTPEDSLAAVLDGRGRGQDTAALTGSAHQHGWRKMNIWEPAASLTGMRVLKKGTLWENLYLLTERKSVPKQQILEDPFKLTLVLGCTP